MFVFPTKLILKSDTAHSGIKVGLSLFYGTICHFYVATTIQKDNFFCHHYKQKSPLFFLIQTTFLVWKNPSVDILKQTISKSCLLILISLSEILFVQGLILCAFWSRKLFSIWVDGHIRLYFDLILIRF